MQSRGESLGKGLALGGGNAELELGGLARTIGAGEGTGTPGGAAVDLGQVGDVGEGLGVAEGDVDDAVVSQGGHGGEGSGLLTTAGGSSGDEETGLLAPVAAGGPDSTGLVPEGLYKNLVSTAIPFYIQDYRIVGYIPSTERGSFHIGWECQTGSRRTG